MYNTNLYPSKVTDLEAGSLCMRYFKIAKEESLPVLKDLFSAPDMLAAFLSGQKEENSYQLTGFREHGSQELMGATLFTRSNLWWAPANKYGLFELCIVSFKEGTGVARCASGYLKDTCDKELNAIAVYSGTALGYKQQMITNSYIKNGYTQTNEVFYLKE